MNVNSSMRRFAITAVALLSVAGTACVKQNQAGVGVTKFDSSAVFGIAADKPVVPGFEVPESFDSGPLPDLPLPNRQNPVPPEGPCPSAKLNAFPKASATPTIKGMPAEGLYTWKRDSYIYKSGDKVQNLPFALQGRSIRRVVRQMPHVFSFEMVEPDPFNQQNSLITSFVVNNNPDLILNRHVGSRTIGVVATPTEDIRIADPRDTPGIFISALETQDSNGKQLSLFSPATPMMVAPLEEGILRTGETFSSLGLDALSGAVIYNSGIVGRTTRVDACGEIVEGYAITLHQTLTSDIKGIGDAENFVTKNETRSIDYIFASQYGALPIGENLSLGDVGVDDVALAARWELGGLAPKPLAAGTK